jgi:hypothetical protein
MASPLVCYKRPEFKAQKTHSLFPISHRLRFRGTDNRCPVSHLTVQILNPPDSTHIRDFAKITLGGCQVRMPEDHLADNLDRCAGPGGICGGMPPQIMGFGLYTHQFSRLNHNIPGSGLTEWEDSFV